MHKVELHDRVNLINSVTLKIQNNCDIFILHIWFIF